VLYHSTVKKPTHSKSERHEAGASRSKTRTSITAAKPKVSREFIHSLRGKYRGEGLMKALMAEKKREREL
jgi:hypothetical protein